MANTQELKKRSWGRIRKNHHVSFGKSRLARAALSLLTCVYAVISRLHTWPVSSSRTKGSSTSTTAHASDSCAVSAEQSRSGSTLANLNGTPHRRDDGVL